MEEIYSSARVANPRQPITFGILPGSLDGSLAQFEIESSDIITFHSYEPLAQTMMQINDLRQLNRPLICTEYMARTAGSTFHTHTFYFLKESIGAINWGLLAGKTRGKQQDFRLQDFKRLHRLRESSATETSDFYKTSIDFNRLHETSEDFIRLFQTS